MLGSCRVLLFSDAGLEFAVEGLGLLVFMSQVSGCGFAENSLSNKSDNAHPKSGLFPYSYSYSSVCRVFP